MIIDEDVYEDHLAHYGVLRRSGRYPWGSGQDPEGQYPWSHHPTQNQRNKAFLDHINDLKRQGLSEPQISKGLDIPIAKLRAAKTIARAEQKQAQINQAQRLKDKGNANTAIGKIMGLNESSVRALLAPGAASRSDLLTNTSNMLMSEVDTKKMVDVGAGVESQLHMSRTNLDVAIAMAEEKGYTTHIVPIPQIGTGKDTKTKVLAEKGVTQRDVFLNRNNIKTVFGATEDGGHSFSTFHDPISVHPDRVQVRYKEGGGEESDGLIYVRPGVSDISLGKSRYAQVRVKVGDGHYLKGMAMYRDDLPKGTDLLFNTAKSSTGNKLDAMKPLSSDKELPFESVVRQITEHTGTPDERVTSAMNIVNEEGDWAKWSKPLSSQFLSKQPPALAKSQLDQTYGERKKTFDEINGLTNPTVKKKLLEKFAEGADSAAVHLKAAHLPRQNWHSILPIDTMNPGEIYAPKYNNGEKVVLIRFPHGGTFEIPELTVNNNHREARALLGGDVPDVVGIHHSVAQRLSGADFDGDTVLVIPNNNRKIQHTPALQDLKGFNPRDSYPPYHGMTTIAGGTYNAETKSVDYGGRKPTNRKQQAMGDISNLITDMTIKGAPHSEIARAVRHSMVIIDSEKHSLDHRQSALDNGIKALKKEYQGRSNAGAATLISRKKSFDVVPERKERPMREGGPVDKTTGRKVYVETGRPNKTSRVNRLADTSDARSLSSDTPIENLYADHSNRLKDLANSARLNAVNTPPLEYSPSANKAWSAQVTSLTDKLNLAKQNQPLERQAQVLANAEVRARKDANPLLDGDTLKKIKYQALAKARIRTGASKQKRQINITPDEWDAIQAGAISNHRLEQILNNTDIDAVRQLATPRSTRVMASDKVARARAMFANGATRAEVAKALGVSVTTLDASIQQHADSETQKKGV